MKLVKLEKLTFRLNQFFDENDDLITPENMLRFQLGFFDHLLEEDEVVKFYESNSLGENFFYNESVYLNFITEIFSGSKENVYVEVDKNELTNSLIISILNDLDYQDKDLWIEFIKQLSNFDDRLIKIESLKELKMFFKLATREIIFPKFYLENDKVVLLGNYDLFFPIFFENTDLVIKYKKIALKYNLHILEINN